MAADLTRTAASRQGPGEATAGGLSRRRAILRLLGGIVVAGVAVAGLDGASAAAVGNDVCPEPNGAFQAACYLGAGVDTVGFISRPDDVDAYRFETRDFGIRVQLALPDRPYPYRLSLVSYNGDVL